MTKQSPQNAAKETKGRATFVPFVGSCEVSCRWPVLVFVAAGLCWLAVGLGLALIASVKLVVPGLLADYSWLSYGRIQPAAWNALVYGFGAQVGLGVGVWLACRLSGAPLVGRGTVLLAAFCWNTGLKIGIFGILIGDSTGVETLELPACASPLLFGACVCMAACMALTFHTRREREWYISQWYILGALLSFPWLYSAANLLAVFAPLRGVLQAAVQAWYAHNLFTVWLGFIGLAALFYFIPKLTGAPIPSRRLAVVGFWTLALFGSFGGLERYAGGPFPAWMQSVGVVAGVCALLPVLAVVANLAGALRNCAASLKTQPAMRFVLFGFCAYALGGVLGVANALPPVRRMTQFTLFSTALEQLALQGFVAMSLCGALYFILPRLLACEWPSLRAMRAHFGGAAAGVCLSFLALGLGGLVQGRALDNPAVAFAVVVERCQPFLLAAALANALLWLGGVSVTVHLLWLLGRCWRARCLPAAREWFREQRAAEGGQGMNPVSEPHLPARASSGPLGGAPSAPLFSMNRGWPVGVGLLLALAASGFTLVVWPHLQFGGQAMVTIETTGESYPLPRAGEAARGQAVYRANGCHYCHTQQVRSPADGADIARGWGSRRTVARDYLRDSPVMLGARRVGPDLANAGARQTNALDLLRRFYDPRLATPGSVMPPHPFLFERRRLRAGRSSPEALQLPVENAAPAGYEVVPRPEALALVAYLQSLRAEALFFEVYPSLPPPNPNLNPNPNPAPSSSRASSP